MNGIFSLDGPFYKFGSVLWDIMALSLLWILFSVPVFTAGAATTALYYVMTRRVSKAEGYITSDFWRSFKTNFKQATLIWAAVFFAALLLIFNIRLILNEPQALGLPPAALMVMLPMQILLFIELVLLALYAFPIVARFDIRGKALFKTAALMAHKHLPTTVMLLLMFFLLASFAYVYMNVFLIVFFPGIYAYAASFFFVRVFRKYRPDMDKSEVYDEKGL